MMMVALMNDFPWLIALLSSFLVVAIKKYTFGYVDMLSILLAPIFGLVVAALIYTIKKQ